MRYYDGSQTVADPMLLDKCCEYPERPWQAAMGGAGLPLYFFTNDDVIISESEEDTPFSANRQAYNGVQGVYPDPLALWEGDAGWSAVFAVIADGERRVLQVYGWTGGAGVAPATGDYVGVAGLVANIAADVDFRGDVGAQGAGLVLSGVLAAPANLPPTGSAGETYLVGAASPRDVYITTPRLFSPSVAKAAFGGAMDQIDHRVFTAVTAVDLALPAGFSAFKLVDEFQTFSNFLGIRVSSDAGANFDAGGADYFSGENDNNAFYFSNLGNACSFELKVFGARKALTFTGLKHSYNTTTFVRSSNGAHRTNVVVDALRLFDPIDALTGQVWLTGLKEFI